MISAGAFAFPGTSPVAFDLAVVLPSEFFAVTWNRSVLPTSVLTTVYWVPVALVIFLQLIAFSLQRSHWNE